MKNNIQYCQNSNYKLQLIRPLLQSPTNTPHFQTSSDPEITGTDRKKSKPEYVDPEIFGIDRKKERTGSKEVTINFCHFLTGLV